MELRTPTQLIDFETEIARQWEAGQIKAPVHLHGGNEEQLCGVFQEYKPGEWVFSTHRSHYHWLLSGHDPKELRGRILSGHSMHIFGDKFFSSSIVGGVAPIAVGVALALKLKGNAEKVWCFLGEMAAETGIAHEAMKYATRQGLNVKFVIEDNGYSVNTKTQEVWGTEAPPANKIIYKYTRRWPHAGTGKWVAF